MADAMHDLRRELQARGCDGRPRRDQRGEAEASE
jgi:hypothetical protein